MPTIHAFRRQQDITIDTGAGVIDFTANAAGDMVAEIDEGAALDVLLGIPEAFCPYLDANTVSYVLGSGDSALDLGAMTIEALKGFAQEHGVILKTRITADKIRQTIIDQLTDK